MKRTQLTPHKKTFWVKRKQGKFADMQSIPRCIRQDAARKAKTKAKPGQKFQGD